MLVYIYIIYVCMYVCMYVFIYSVPIVIHLKMSANPVTAKVGQSVQLVCTVMNAYDLQTEIMFVRQAGVRTEPCGTISQHSAECLAHNVTSKYFPSCGSGTNESSSKVKDYALDIVRVEVGDYGNWWCTPNATNIKHELHGITLTETSKWPTPYNRKKAVVCIILSVG